MGYKIGSFNCLNFGSGRCEKAHLIAKIIAEEKFDIVALQEVKNYGALKLLLSALKNYGKHWDGACDEWGSADYAFVWNTKRVQLIHVKNKNGERVVSPHTVTAKGASKVLARAPYCARFEPASKGVPKFEIRIINTHIRYGRQKNDDGLLERGLVALRQAEYAMLTQTIYPTVAGKSIINNIPSTRFCPIYTIMIGDYNLNKRSSKAMSPYLQDCYNYGFGERKKVIVTEQDELTTLKSILNNSAQDENQNTSQGCVYANNYDHITYDSIRFSDVVEGYGSVDVIRKHFNNDVSYYRNNVSDHIPIFFSLDLKRR